MVPTRQCSTLYRRSIRAASSTGMVMGTVPANASRAQVAQTHMGQQRPSAVPAGEYREGAAPAAAGALSWVNAMGKRWTRRRWVCRMRAVKARHLRRGNPGASHYRCHRARRAGAANRAAGASTLCERHACVGRADCPGSARRPLALARAGCVGARLAAILLTAIAVRAQQHLVAAPRAQEQAC